MTAVATSASRDAAERHERDLRAVRLAQAIDGFGDARGAGRREARRGADATRRRADRRRRPDPARRAARGRLRRIVEKDGIGGPHDVDAAAPAAPAAPASARRARVAAATPRQHVRTTCRPTKSSGPIDCAKIIVRLPTRDRAPHDSGVIHQAAQARRVLQQAAAAGHDDVGAVDRRAHRGEVGAQRRLDAQPRGVPRPGSFVSTSIAIAGWRARSSRDDHVEQRVVAEVTEPVIAAEQQPHVLDRGLAGASA